jgi:hypothetical protein
MQPWLLTSLQGSAGYFGRNSARCIKYSIMCFCWYVAVGGVSQNRVDVQFCGQFIVVTWTHGRSVYGRHDSTVCYTFHCCRWRRYVKFVSGLCAARPSDFLDIALHALHSTVRCLHQALPLCQYKDRLHCMLLLHPPITRSSKIWSTIKMLQLFNGQWRLCWRLVCYTNWYLKAWRGISEKLLRLRWSCQ